MNRTIVVLLFTLLVFGGFFTALFYTDVSREAHFLWTDVKNIVIPLEGAWVQVDAEHYRVRVAQAEAERRRGLQFHRGLQEKNGMLFVFESSGTHSIWMKHTYIPLDILWIEDDEVVALMESVPSAAYVPNPPIYTPNASANYVLELPAGTAQQDGLTVGDPVFFTFEGDD